MFDDVGPVGEDPVPAFTLGPLRQAQGPVEVLGVEVTGDQLSDQLPPGRVVPS